MRNYFYAKGEICMKISKKIAAAVSCVMIAGCAASCGKKDDSSTPDDSEKTITISALPKTCVTDVLDLTSYITCEGGTGDFKVTIDESVKDFAGVDMTGKKIFAEHSGEIPFTVTYSGKTEQGSATFVSEEYKAFIENADLGYNYGIYLLNEDLNDFEGYLNVYENFYVDWFTGKGYAEIDDQVYSFTLYEDDEEQIFADYQITGLEPDAISEIVTPWSFDPSIVKCLYNPEETDEESGKVYEAYESMIIDDKETVDLITEKVFGYSLQLLSRYDYAPTRVEFTEEILTDREGNETLCYDAYLFMNVTEGGITKEYFFNMVILDFSDEAFMSEDLIDLFEEAHPVKKDNSALLSAFDEVLDGKNYTVTYDAGWYSEDNQKLESNPFVTEETEGLGTMINHYLNASTSFAAFVTENQTYIENGSADHSVGLVAHEGDVYVYGGSLTETEGVEFNADLLAKNESIFGEEIADEPYSYWFLRKNESEDSLMESVFANELFEVDENTSGFTFSGYGNEELFEKLFKNAVPMIGRIEDVEDDMEYLAQFADVYQVANFLLEEEMIRYLSCTFTMTKVSETETIFDISFVWEDEIPGEDEYSEGTPVYYVLDVTFLNFGNTVLPEGIEINYPSAE